MRLLEGDDLDRLTEWAAHWNDLVDFEFVPVVSSAQARAALLGPVIETKAWPSREAHMALLRTAVVFAAFYWFWLWYVPFSLLQQDAVLLRSPVVLAVGGALCVAGFMITALCAIEFALRGGGTPAPFDPPRRLVTGALYRRIRNPMYAGFIMLMAGEAVLLGSRAIALLAVGFWMLAHAFVVLYEEPALRRKFGAEYEAYRAAVPRWIPRLRG